MSKLILFILLFLIACHSNPYPQGKVLYDYHCANCHMEDGSGLVKLIPPLTESSMLLSHPDRVACVIRHGIQKNPSTGQEMPQNLALNEVEISNLVNYLRFTIDTQAEAVKVGDVEKWLSACHIK